MIVCLTLLVLALAAAFLIDRTWRLRRGLPSSLRDQLPDDLIPVDPEQERAAWARQRGGFDVVLRGYRMDQVDARIAELEQQLQALRANSDT